MADTKYGKYFVTELKKDIPVTPWHPKVPAAGKGQGGRIVFMDSEMVPGASYAEAVWIRDANSEVQRKGGVQAHSHDYDEVLGFIGTNPDDLYDLGGEIELWLGEEKHMLTKTCLVFIPGGLKHCPLRVRKIETPVLHFSSHSGKMYTAGGQDQQKQEIGAFNKLQVSPEATEYGKLIVSELKKNIVEAPWSPPNMQPAQKGKTGRVLWLDNETVPGAFYMECVWVYPRKVNSENRGTKAHVHDYDEVLAFFGTDPDNPHDLGAEADFWIEDEKHTFTKSCLIFVPKGIRHSPLRFNYVDRRLFHFTLGPGGMYF